MGKKRIGPHVDDVATLMKAGINPNTGLPVKLDIDETGATKSDIKKAMRIIDEQDAVNRYTWYNLPNNLSSQELERLIYYKGQLAFFYMKDLDQFFFMPYALDGTIDFYGRFNTIHPVPMTSGTTDEEKKQAKTQAEYLSKLKLKCVYGIKMPYDLKIEDLYDSAVLLYDYTKQLSETLISRQIINDPIIDIMAEILPYLRTSLLTGTGITGVRVNDADQSKSVMDGAKGMRDAAQSGKPWIPLVGNLEFQQLSGGSLIKAQDYLLALQSLDNLRLSTYGLENGGLFEKKAHMLESEQQMNSSNIGLVYQDGLAIRQNFCNIVNSIWNLGIWCMPSENETMADYNGDGLLDNNTNSENSGITAPDNDGGDSYDSNGANI